jgi:hypothetical protein
MAQPPPSTTRISLHSEFAEGAPAQLSALRRAAGTSKPWMLPARIVARRASPSLMEDCTSQPIRPVTSDDVSPSKPR